LADPEAYKPIPRELIRDDCEVAARHSADSSDSFLITVSTGYDGMRCDIDGNLYMTRHGQGTVVVMTPSGDILREIDVLGFRPQDSRSQNSRAQVARISRTDSSN
jgi:sugar lactone lactonase YvrE